MDARETTILSAILISASIIGVIITYFIISIIRQQRLNQQLYKSRILAEISTLEKERERMAADLHDELGPILASVKFKLSSLEIFDGEDQLTLEKINNNLDEIIRRMREISNNLLPTVLLRKGLTAAMQESIEHINSFNKLEVKFAYEIIPNLGHQKSVNIYRMFQEIIHNTIKHANASELRIELKTVQNKLILLTEDNGTGFDYVAKSKENTGLGLRNLLSRTEMLGGNMYIDSRKGKGTKYTFEIPV
jgi:signal transduction histidine kinase